MSRLLCVVDLEATCWERQALHGPNGEGSVEPRSEIIEVGAVLLDGETLAEVPEAPEFQAFVRPKLSPVLSDFCKSLTHIRQEDVDSAKPFPGVVADFLKWAFRLELGHAGVPRLACWGNYDANQLDMDCELWGLPGIFLPDHLNIKNHVAERMRWKPSGLGKTARRIGLPFEGMAHRALNDARMTARVLRRAEGKC